MKVRKACTVALFAIAAGLLIGFAITPWLLDPIGYAYSGKTLMDKTEYQEFKQSMATDEVSNYSVNILNTDYPILVQYEFTAQANDIIVPGTVSVEKLLDCSIIPGMFLAIIPMMLGTYLWTKENREENSK